MSFTWKSFCLFIILSCTNTSSLRVLSLRWEAGKTQRIKIPFYFCVSSWCREETKWEINSSPWQILLSVQWDLAGSVRCPIALEESGHPAHCSSETGGSDTICNLPLFLKVVVAKSKNLAEYYFKRLSIRVPGWFSR